MAIGPGATTAAARLDAKEIVEQRHNEVVMEVAALMTDGERHDRKAVRLGIAEHLDVRVLRPGVDRPADEAFLQPANRLGANSFLQFEDEACPDRSDDVGRSADNDTTPFRCTEVFPIPQDADVPAGRGIGRAVALTLARAGSDVALVARSKDELQSVAQEIQVLGRRAMVFPADLTQIQQISSLAAEIARAAGPTLDTQPWMVLDSYLETMLSVQGNMNLVIMVIIFLALSFGLVNTLVMAVFERVREIGLMLALGMKPAMILGQIIVESLMLLLIGLLTLGVMLLPRSQTRRVGVAWR